MLGSNGVAYGTGDNASGQLTGDESEVRTLTPLAGLPSGVGATAIAAGGFHSLVLGDDGNVYGTGLTSDGQLTDIGPTSGPPYVRTLTPLTGIPLGVNATAVATGTMHSLVLGNDGNVYGTGDNFSG